VKRFLTAVWALGVAAVALCQLSKYKDWSKSPEAYFLTAAERQEWAKVQSDADAEKFIADYWARRGGSKFKDAVERRIAAADQQFKLRRQKGSESVRGRIFITLGNPTRVSEAHEGGGPGQGQATTGAGAIDSTSSAAVVQTWVYAKDKFDASWGIGELQAQINVDPQRGTDEAVNSGPINKAIEAIAEHTIVNPSGQGVAAVKPAVPAAATGTAPPPPPAPAAAIPAASRAALEPLLKSVSEGPTATFFGGAFRTSTGEPFYAFRIAVPGEKVSAGAAVKLGGVVTREDGSEATSFWEDAALADLRTASHTDKCADHSVVLPAGSYRGAFGLFSADGATALSSVSTAFVLESKPGEWSVSPIILAAGLTPLSKRPEPTDPFVFGTVKVEPKVGGILSGADNFGYFYTVSNPALPAEAAAPTPAPASTPAPGVTPAAAPAPTPVAPRPRIMTRLVVAKDGQQAFLPATMPAELQQLAPGYYAGGSEIPLASFKPGYYSFTLNIRDLNAPKDSTASKGVDRSGQFVVLAADGSMPPTATPVVKTPTPKPRTKKS